MDFNLLFIAVMLVVGFIASIFYMKSINYTVNTYLLMAGIIVLNVLEIYPNDIQKKGIYFHLLMILFASIQIFRLWQHNRAKSQKAEGLSE